MPHLAVRVIQHVIGLRLAPGAEALVQFGIMLGMICAARRAALAAPALPIASVPTGMARGIWTME